MGTGTTGVFITGPGVCEDSAATPSLHHTLPSPWMLNVTRSGAPKAKAPFQLCLTWATVSLLKMSSQDRHREQPDAEAQEPRLRGRPSPHQPTARVCLRRTLTNHWQTGRVRRQRAGVPLNRATSLPAWVILVVRALSSAVEHPAHNRRRPGSNPGGPTPAVATEIRDTAGDPTDREPRREDRGCRSLDRVRQSRRSPDLR